MSLYGLRALSHEKTFPCLSAKLSDCQLTAFFVLFLFHVNVTSAAILENSATDSQVINTFLITLDFCYFVLQQEIALTVPFFFFFYRICFFFLNVVLVVLAVHVQCYSVG